MTSQKFFSSLYLTSNWTKVLFAVYKPRYNAEYYRRLLAYEDQLKTVLTRRADLTLLSKLNGFKQDVTEMLSLSKLENMSDEDKVKFLAYEEKVMPNILAIPNKIHKSVSDSDEIVDVVKQRNASDMPKKMLDHIKLSYINSCMYKSVVGPNSQYYYGLGAKLHLAVLDYFSNQLEKKLNFNYFSGLCLVKSAVVEAVNSYNDKTFKDDCCRIMDDRSHVSSDLNVGEHLVETSRESCSAFISRCHLNKSIDTPLRLMSSGASYRAGQQLDEKQLVKQTDIVYCMSVTSSREKDSNEEFLTLIDHIWNCYKQLAIPCRIVHCGVQQLKSNEYDSYRLDTWLPSKSAWIPVARLSNYLDYITTRINLKRGHIIDATAVDSNVLIMSIIENNQEVTGKFKIPQCLREFTLGLTEAEEKDYFGPGIVRSPTYTASSAMCNLQNYTSKRYYHANPFRKSLFSHSKRFQKNMHPPLFYIITSSLLVAMYVTLMDMKSVFNSLPVGVQRFLYNYILRLLFRPVVWFFTEPVEAVRPVNDYYDDYVGRQEKLRKEKELAIDAAKKRRLGQ